MKRGAFILENLLGDPPPPPPNDVPPVKETTGATLKERLKSHREMAACARCHQKIDPPGFALENFNAIGKWREKEEDTKLPVDPSGELKGIGAFKGFDDFKRLLASRSQDVTRCLCEKLLLYALGRPLDAEGMATAYFSNGMPMTNARIARLAALKNLRSIGFDHSGYGPANGDTVEAFSGAGWEALIDSQVEEVHLGGTKMGPPWRNGTGPNDRPPSSHLSPCSGHQGGHRSHLQTSKVGELHRFRTSQHFKGLLLVWSARATRRHSHVEGAMYQ